MCKLMDSIFRYIVIVILNFVADDNILIPCCPHAISGFNEECDPSKLFKKFLFTHFIKQSLHSALNSR